MNSDARDTKPVVLSEWGTGGSLLRGALALVYAHFTMVLADARSWFGLAALACLLAVLHFWRVLWRTDEQGLQEVFITGRRRTIPWSEVREVRFRPVPRIALATRWICFSPLATHVTRFLRAIAGWIGQPLDQPTATELPREEVAKLLGLEPEGLRRLVGWPATPPRPLSFLVVPLAFGAAFAAAQLAPAAGLLTVAAELVGLLVLVRRVGVTVSADGIVARDLFGRGIFASWGEVEGCNDITGGLRVGTAVGDITIDQVGGGAGWLRGAVGRVLQAREDGQRLPNRGRLTAASISLASTEPTVTVERGLSR